jgi:hypothetical protein
MNRAWPVSKTVKMFRTESVLIRHTNYNAEQMGIYTVSQ